MTDEAGRSAPGPLLVARDFALNEAAAPAELPVLTIFRLSDSFETVWSDLAHRAGARAVVVTDVHEIVPASAAVIVAAAGMEKAGLDAVSTLRSTGAFMYLVGANASHRLGVEASRRGASDYFVLPPDHALLQRSVTTRVETARHTQPHGASTGGFGGILGASLVLTSVLERSKRLAGHDNVTVLIQGETGTGKELLARALHDHGPRHLRPFVAINCAAIPPSLIESELFGHERGAFTDAHRDKPGLFEQADSGTLFLDEVGHLPLSLQSKILRVLEDRAVRRVGSNKAKTVDVRIIAATHVDLRQAVSEGRFREDLFYRLNVVGLHLPPLRARGADIEHLALQFAQSLAHRYQLPVPDLDGRVRTALRGHSWPGNVRELHHAIERAILLSPPGQLLLEELDIGDPPPHPERRRNSLPFPGRMQDIMRAAARQMVVLSDGNKSEAARRLGISRSRLLRLIRPGDPGRADP